MYMHHSEHPRLLVIEAGVRKEFWEILDESLILQMRDEEAEPQRGKQPSQGPTVRQGIRSKCVLEHRPGEGQCKMRGNLSCARFPEEAVQSSKYEQQSHRKPEPGHRFLLVTHPDSGSMFSHL